MDSGAWWATVNGVKKRVGHDLAIKQQHKGTRVTSVRICF